jgi:hypothetical protein
MVRGGHGEEHQVSQPAPSFDKAYQGSGEYFCEFSRVEQVIGELVRVVMV